MNKNTERKAKYAAQAAERASDKEARNAAIEAALAEGKDNVVGVEYKDEETGKTIRVSPGIVPTMPTSASQAKGKESRSQKRLRLKARRHKALSPTKHKHPFGRCGNVGCKRCFPETSHARQ